MNGWKDGQTGRQADRELFALLQCPLKLLFMQLLAIYQKFALFALVNLLTRIGATCFPFLVLYDKVQSLKII